MRDAIRDSWHEYLDDSALEENDTDERIVSESDFSGFYEDGRRCAVELKAQPDRAARAWLLGFLRGARQ